MRTQLLVATTVALSVLLLPACPDKSAAPPTPDEKAKANEPEPKEAVKEAPPKEEPKEQPAAAADPTPPAETGPTGSIELKTVGPDSPLLKPDAAKEKAPDKFKAKFETTAGDFVVEVDRALAPQGADRFYNLVKIGYFENVVFFRVIKGFMVQFGIHGDPAVNRMWQPARIPDDPVKASNARGMLTFATSGPNSRTVQLFINYNDNKNLDGMGFSPIGKVIDDGMKAVDAIHGGYGEGAPRGRGPDQGRMQGQGNTYLKSDFPKMDYIKKATLL